MQDTAQLLHRAIPSTSPLQTPYISKPQVPTEHVNNPYAVTLPRVEKEKLKQNVKPPRVQPTTAPPVAPPHRLHFGSKNFKIQALHYLQHQLQFQPKAFHIFNKETGKKETIDSLRTGPDSVKWNRAISNEFGRLATGNKFGVESTDTIEFITKNDVPDDRKVTYGSYRFDVIN